MHKEIAHAEDLPVLDAGTVSPAIGDVGVHAVRTADYATVDAGAAEAVIEPGEEQWRRSLRLQGREYRPMKSYELDSMKDYIRCVGIREARRRSQEKESR